MSNFIGKAANSAMESLFMRFLKNAGVEDFIDNPKDYKLEMKFVEDGAVIKIKKGEES